MILIYIYLSALTILLIANIILPLKACKNEASNELTKNDLSVKSLGLEKIESTSWAPLGSLKGDFRQFIGVLAHTSKQFIETAYIAYVLKFRARTFERKIARLKELRWNQSELLFVYSR